MRPERNWTVKLLLLLSLALLNTSGLTGEPIPLTESLDAGTKRYTVSTKKPYDDILDDLQFAISQHNYRVTGRSQIGEAIAKSEGIDFPRSTIIHFCSLQVAHEVFSLNPEFLLHMPCRIALRADNGVVLIEARLVPETDPRTTEIALRINAMMRDIADYAAK